MNQKTQPPPVTFNFLPRWLLVNVIGWAGIFAIASRLPFIEVNSDFIIGHAVGIAIIAILQGITLSGYLRFPYTWSILSFISFAFMIPTGYYFIHTGLFFSFYKSPIPGFIFIGPMSAKNFCY